LNRCKYKQQNMKVQSSQPKFLKEDTKRHSLSKMWIWRNNYWLYPNRRVFFTYRMSCSGTNGACNSSQFVMRYGVRYVVIDKKPW